MKSRVEEVCKKFNDGFSCSQAIFSSYCEDFGIDRDIASKISCGLAAGMARLGSTCGAVTGAYLVIGLIHGNCRPEDKELKEKTFELIQEFDKQFRAKHGSTNCRELLGVDLLLEDKALAGGRVQAICPGLVKSAAEILESIALLLAAEESYAAVAEGAITYKSAAELRAALDADG
jgi:C_GCAxxG_C_C family probable redox protein